MDNGTMVEAFKFLNYSQLATSSLVSKRFWNVIRTHRNKFALLDVDCIGMYCDDLTQDPAVIEMFKKEFSFEEYNEWTVRHGYSEQVPLEGQIAAMESAENGHDIYMFWANVYQNHCHDIATDVFFARAEHKNETWPLFQHFFRLLIDPFIYIRTLELNLKNDALSLLAGGMNPDRDRLHCKQLKINFDEYTQKLISWIKDHVRCDELLLDNFYGSDYDEVFLDLFLIGAPCTSAINVVDCDLSQIIAGFVQKFMGLKNSDEYLVVESIRGNDKDRAIVETLKHDCARFITKEEQFEERNGTRQVIEFINNDIEKKLTFSIKNFYYVVCLN
ncbi:hypothetical protein Ddc_24720 [Ditylenchus destructor]|nr:hypothetical protein Ddc_24720 [Ditylenchus destructor]